MAQFNKNEVVAAKRQVRCMVYQSDGVSPAAWSTDFAGSSWLDTGNGNAVLTANQLVNCTRAFAFADQAISAFPGANNATIAAHPFHEVNAGPGLPVQSNGGIGPVRLTTTGTLPGGLAVNTDYWLIYVDANTVAFATSRANAALGTKIVLVGGGSGVIQVTQVGVSTPTTMPINGAFVWQASQAETNQSVSELSLHVEKDGMAPFETVINMSGSSAFDSTAEGGNTYGDLLRLCASVLGGKVQNYTTGTYAFKSLDGTKTRITFTSDSTGRLTNAIGDLT